VIPPVVCRLFLRVFVLSLLVLAGMACARPAVKGTPAARRYTFPPEWAPHDAVWLGWSDDASHHPVQVEIVRALAPTVAVRFLVTSDSARAEAETALAAAGVPLDRVEFFTHPVENTWIRDAGPRFLTDGRNLGVADFAWNWYGYPEKMSRGWPTRACVDDDLARGLGLPLVSSAAVAEGGALDVSTSVILTYRQTALQRNPGLPLKEIEAEYLRVYGKKRVLWLSRSPLGDLVTDRPKIENYVGWGGNGHIDEYARFVNDSTIVVAQIDPSERDDDPLTRADHDILAENLAELRAAVNVDGRPFHLVTLPVPAVRHHLRTRPVTADDKASDFGRVVLREFAVGDEVHFVPALSYVNFVVSNGIVLVPSYWQEGLPEREREKDELARATLQRLFPNRRVVQIHSLAINWGGGGMHCMTQQQPRPQ
jgi:agmatine deiminase